MHGKKIWLTIFNSLALISKGHRSRHCFSLINVFFVHLSQKAENEWRITLLFLISFLTKYVWRTFLQLNVRSQKEERGQKGKKVFIVEGSFIVVALLVRYFLPLLKIMRFTSFLSLPFAFPQKSGFFNLKAEPKTLNDTCTWSIRNSLKLKRVDVEESWK